MQDRNGIVESRECFQRHHLLWVILAAATPSSWPQPNKQIVVGKEAPRPVCPQGCQLQAASYRHPFPAIYPSRPSARSMTIDQKVVLRVLGICTTSGLTFQGYKWGGRDGYIAGKGTDEGTSFSSCKCHPASLHRSRYYIRVWALGIETPTLFTICWPTPKTTLRTVSLSHRNPSYNDSR